MGRFYKTQLHGPIQDYAYELPFNELFTLQKYKREEEGKAMQALQSGYDSLFKLNYKPGDEAKVAQLRNNFKNLTDNIYKKYGNNLANATSSIQQGINSVLDSGLVSDINANYKTWVANEATKAALYKTGQFQPMPQVDAQAYTPTEDVQGRRRDYQQYLAAVDMRPEQEAIYNNIPQEERTLARLDQSARASALQYGLSNPQHLIQRYGEGIVPILNAATQGDGQALQQVQQKAYEMLKETLPEYVSTQAGLGSVSTKTKGSDEETPIDYEHPMMTIMDLYSSGSTPTLTTVDVKEMLNLSGDEGDGYYDKRAIPTVMGDNSLIIKPGTFKGNNAGFVQNADGSWLYNERGLNPTEAAEQAAKITALDEYYNTYEAQYNELGIGISKETVIVEEPGRTFRYSLPTTRTVEKPANVDENGNPIEFDPQRVYESGVFAKIKENPNLNKLALKRVQELGINPDDPETVSLYKAYKAYKDSQTADQQIADITENMITALAASGARVDFTPNSDVAGNMFISTGPNGRAVLNIRGIGTTAQSAIDNIIGEDAGVLNSEEKGGYWFDGKDAWTDEDDGLVGPGKLFRKSQVIRVPEEDGTYGGEPLYDFDMVYQIPLNWEKADNYNKANYKGSETPFPAIQAQQKKEWDKRNELNIVRALNNEISQISDREVYNFVKEKGRGNNKTYELDNTRFENTDVNNPNAYKLNAKGLEELTSKHAKGISILQKIANTSPNAQMAIDVLNVLKNELENTFVDSKNEDDIIKYGENLSNLYQIVNYLEDGAQKMGSDDEALKPLGRIAVASAINKLLDTSESIMNTGVDKGKIVNPDILREFTKMKAEGMGLTPIQSMSKIDLANNMYGPYASQQGIALLQKFNSVLESEMLTPIILNSAFRTKSYNETLPQSARKSEHLTGNAFDLDKNNSADRLYTYYNNKKELFPEIEKFFLHTVNGHAHYHISLK